MKRVLTVALLIAFPAVTSWAGYREERRALEAWHPDSGTTQPSKTGEGSPAQNTRQSAAEVIPETSSRREAIASGAGQGESPVFMSPEPARVAALSPPADLPVLGGDFTLTDLEIAVLSRNQGVAAARENFRASLETFGLATELELLLRGFAPFTAALMTGVGGGMEEGMAGVFPSPGLASLRAEVVRREVEGAREELEIARRWAVSEARRLFWELGYLAEARRLAAASRDAAIALGRSALERYAAGEEMAAAPIEGKMMAAAMSTELVSLEREEMAVRDALRRLLAVPADTPLGTPSARVSPNGIPELGQLRALARERRQEVRMMRATLAGMEAMFRMTTREAVPTLSLGFSFYPARHAVSAGSMAMEPTFPTDPPGEAGPRQPLYALMQASRLELGRRVDAMRAELRDAEAETDLMVREAWNRLDRAGREVTLAQGLAASAGLIRESALARYRAGDAPLKDAVEAERLLLDKSLALARALADVGRSRADLEEAVGVSPITTPASGEKP